MNHKLFRSISALLLAAAVLFPSAGMIAPVRAAGPLAEETEPAAEREPQADGEPISEEAAFGTEQSPEETAAEEYPDYSGILCLSEVMTKNRATVLSPDGTFEDWVELYNNGTSTVCLDSWRLKSKKTYFSLDGRSIGPGEYLVIFVPSAENSNDEDTKIFSLKDDRKLTLLDPEDREISEWKLPKLSKDMSYTAFNGGEPAATIYATPGYPNTDEGYLARMSAMPKPDGLIISEAMSYNTKLLNNYRYGYPDWVEITNTGSTAIALGDYSLTDDLADPERYRLPDLELAPGECIVIPCTDKAAPSNDPNVYLAAGFGLDSGNETVYLTCSGKLTDYISLKQIPLGCSCGRRSGETGVSYFSVPSPGSANKGGCPMISAAPAASVPGGVYDNTDVLIVELSGSGTIYYTLDSSAPTTDSYVYTEPLHITKNTVLRAIDVVSGKLTGPGAVFNYIINSGHTLPVLCLNTDSPKDMAAIYNSGNKQTELAANLSFYSEDVSFSENCCVSMNGGTSLQLDKKNMIVSFKGAYGASATDCDIFGDGKTGLSQLVIRAGQDYFTAMIRNELCQTAAAEFSDNILTTRGRWCVLYLNGKYYGIYSLKEDDDKHLYSDKYGVAESSVEIVTSNIPGSSPLYGFVDYINKNDMTDPEKYEYLCNNLLDINSFVDWIVCEGITGNTDLANGNLKYCRCLDDDGLVRLVYYDLDAGFTKPGAAFLLIRSGEVNYQVYGMHAKLVKNPEYRALLLSRLSDALKGAFSTENMFRIIDEMTAEISSDMPGEMKRWDKLSPQLWQFNLDNLRKKVTDCRSNSICFLKEYPFYLTDEEYEQYFSDIKF